MKTLFIIPARKGSKGLVDKNILELNSSPLINYSIDFALKCKSDGDIICVSSDDSRVLKLAEKKNIKAPFKRPKNISSDNSSTFDVINHALNHYQKEGINFSSICLLQPTSPIRDLNDFYNMKKIYTDKSPDMVVSVSKSKHSPYFSMFKENEDGFLETFFDDVNYTRRQDVPKTFNYNGSIYLFNYNSYKLKGSFNFNKIIKYVMNEEKSIDIDNFIDFKFAEFLIKNKK